MTRSCICCVGPHRATPTTAANAPRRSRLLRRVGDYGGFLQTMLAEASSAERSGLRGLRTRLPEDPAIALFDAFAVMGDVLTFYQERIANEGYLRTAEHRRSVYELAKLVGYKPRPGVSASALLAYTIDENAPAVEIPAGSKAQSVPEPGQQMQTFETTQPLNARAEWNVLRPRRGRPPQIDVFDAYVRTRIRFAGVNARLKEGDRLVFLFANPVRPEHALGVVRRVAGTEASFEGDFTEASLASRGPAHAADASREAFKLICEAHEIFAETAAGVSAIQRMLLPTFRELELGAPWQQFAARVARARQVLTPTMQARFGPVVSLLDKALEHVAAARAPSARAFTPVDRLAVAARLTKTTRKTPAAAPTWSTRSDATLQMLGRFKPDLGASYVNALRRAPPRREAFRVPDGDASLEPLYGDLRLAGVFVLRANPSLFGANAPETIIVNGAAQPNPRDLAPLDTSDTVSLDPPDDTLAQDSLVLIERSAPRLLTSRLDWQALVLGRAGEIEHLARGDYALQSRTTRFSLVRLGDREALNWHDEEDERQGRFALKHAAVFTHSNELTLSDDPDETFVAGSDIELDRLFDGLAADRDLILVGERADITDGDGVLIRGVEGREALVLAGAEHDAPEIGDRLHTWLRLTQTLAHPYFRESVRIFGNVARANHGETVTEVIGSGDAARALQRFALRQGPLTFVSAATPSGVASTLELRLNRVRWSETEALALEGAGARVYEGHIDDEAKTFVTLGDGAHGARAPTGSFNVSAKYRKGIGAPGNVKADAISLLGSRPLGVNAVTNPLATSGGADPDSRDEARRNIPLAVAALDRLVSVRDYADFARRFGGVGQAAATRLSDGARMVVYVTVGGVNDAPLDPDGDVIGSLRAAFQRYGDAATPIVVAPRELKALVIEASLAIDPAYLWEDVEERTRAALAHAFSFNQRAIGRAAYLSEAAAAIHRIRGVLHADIDVFDAVSELDLRDEEALAARLESLRGAEQPRGIVAAAPAMLASADKARAALWPEHRMLPAQIIYLPSAARTAVKLSRIVS